ncbi:protein tyrosine phosphatase-like protein, putative [Hepatocystis sp. ex Piliocolobus tephrosceles]|nr:protein tyrosine phosphatase-like protein, putative [Hepatocystis sp. ex Piliocolobus tephrosceles]
MYSLETINVHINILRSFRNKLPLILYPIGISAEVMCTISSLKNIRSTSALRSFPYAMPNNLNFQIDIYYLSIFVLILYIPGSILIYTAAWKKNKKKPKTTETVTDIKQKKKM